MPVEYTSVNSYVKLRQPFTNKIDLMFLTNPKSSKCCSRGAKINTGAAHTSFLLPVKDQIPSLHFHLDLHLSV